MARNVKKKPEPQLCQPAEIFAALQMLEKERGIPVSYMVDRIKQALINAYRKDREDHRETAAENVVVELTESTMSMVQQKRWKTPLWRSPWTRRGICFPRHSWAA